MWRSIEPDRKWRLAIWSAKIEDMLVESGRMKDAKKRRKSSVFN
jgi:hypothetical protein